MLSTANVAIHASQFPESVGRDLRESLRTRRVNPKFHYHSLKQTQKWLAVHEAYSPSHNDPDCRAVYEKGFQTAAARIKASRVHVIGLGCGSGQKDTRLLKLLKGQGREVFYTPCDVSVPMVLTAQRTALAILPAENCFPFVCDLATADDLPEIIGEGRHVGDPNFLGTAARRPSQIVRLITFFGMIPNFEPQVILPKLAALLRRGDLLLLSANLAPGPDYAAGVCRILPQYDNPLTRDWLMTFLLDLGVEHSDGDLRFRIETCSSRRAEAPTFLPISAKNKQRLLASTLRSSATEDGSSLTVVEVGLKRVAANFHFCRRCRLRVDDETFDFRRGETIRLFFSYRYTPERVRKLFGQHGIEMLAHWLTKSEEEGVFLCCKR